MQAGARKAFGPAGRSLSLLYSLHGGAQVNTLTMPDQQMRSSSSNQASSRMSCSALASRSKASKRARPCLSAAAEIGACIPANTSKRKPPPWRVCVSGAFALQGGSAESDAACFVRELHVEAAGPVLRILVATHRRVLRLLRGTLSAYPHRPWLFVDDLLAALRRPCSHHQLTLIVIFSQLSQHPYPGKKCNSKTA